MKKLRVLFGLAMLVSALLASCSEDTLADPVDGTDSQEQENPNTPETPTDPGDDPQDEVQGIGQVEFFNPGLVDDSYILVNDAKENRVYIIDKQGVLIHEWSLTNNIGNDVVLLPDGRVLASLESDSPQIRFGGMGGRLQLLSADGTVIWDFVYSTPEAETHHDVEMLPNGNVIALVWEKRTAEQSIAEGFMLDSDLYPEAVIEVDPKTNQIVWEWHSWDHSVQDYDPDKANYGVVSEHPELIDINYIPKNGGWPEAKGDHMHANAIAYDAVNDVIFISVNYYSEVWVIDHSTTTEEAAGHTGGRYGKGGDLIYRFGNPQAYENPAGTRLFHNQHFPNLLQGADQGKLLIFSNGNDINQSSVYELQLPAEYTLVPNADNEPQILWSFTDPDLYSGKVSGAVVLPNNNILITEGDQGFWEVTRDQEVVWRYNRPGFIWRGYHYSKDAPEIQAVLQNSN
ncbi:aryl-sulfate sulfotransferase [Robiginitalea marina]|uniref:Aryl-sulfate sulfotransferase n=1 Tax=Robiginitalea marina TaxID=2954105 RepID=A0ABT1B053_9FLAO|nr:aryl-sulfate sulfotransferase [Robiginitalea marina]MCO5725220.1 aryl-sulfate sulfotransferase [Robiginitalea marina]